MRRKRKLRGTEVWGWGRGVGVEWSTFCSRGGPSECNVFEPHPRCRHVVAGPAACDANATTHPSASPPCACARQHAFLLLLSSPSPTPIMHCRRRRAGPFSLFFTFSLSDSQFTTQTQTQSQASSWDSFLFLLPVSHCLFGSLRKGPAGICIFGASHSQYYHCTSRLAASGN